MFEVQGDEKGRRTVFYNCTASRPNQDAGTTEASKTPSTQTISIKMMPRSTDRKVKAVITLNDDNETAYNGFFSTVYESSVSV